jgi:two-component system, cell cycle response regulator
MDAKANTLVCVSPLAQSESEKKVTVSHSAFMLVVAGGIPGTMVPLCEDGTRLGRSADNSFQINDITVSREHAFVTVDNLGSVHIRDAGSTNGTYLNGMRIRPQRLVEVADGDRVQLGTSVVLKLVRLDPKDEQFQREMFERTVRDTLTGLYNRAYLLNQIGVLAERSASQGVGLAVLMLDIDYFKQINDRHGHLAGDGVLRQVAAVLRESTRAEDLVARFGGEEFVVVLPVSVPDLASERAERIRSNLAERTVVALGTEIRVTASIGLAFAGPESARNATALITVADEALYQAKADGRNRVVFGHGGMRRAPKQTESADFTSLLFSQESPLP